MDIRKLRIHNWRSVKSGEITFQNLLMLVGKNNHGKSNILSAVLFLLGKVVAEESDFFCGSNRLFVEAEVVFDADEQQKYSIMPDRGSTVVFRKIADKNGKTVCLLNGEPVSGFFESAEVFFVAGAGRDQPDDDSVIERLLRFFVLQVWTAADSVHVAAAAVRLLEAKLSREMADWGANIEISLSDDTFSSLPVVVPNIYIDNGFYAETMRKSNCLERSLLVSVLRCFAEWASEHPVLNTPFWLVIEEPELFLHPQAQRELAFSLNILSEKGVRILFSTHSSFFIDLSRYRSLCIARRPSLKAGTEIIQQTRKLFSEHSDKKKFNMSYWINPDRGELFFARKVILVEGPTEKVVLPKLAKRAGLMPRESTVIDCAGKTNMSMYITLLNKYRIPYVVVYDRDHQSYRSAAGKEFSTEQSAVIRRITDPKIGEVVEFVNDIEEELGIPADGHKNKPFIALQFIGRSDFLFPLPLLAKLEKIYS